MAKNTAKISKKKREAALIAAFGEIEEAKKPFVLSLIRDFVEIEARCLALEALPTYEIDAKNPKRQRKLPAHDMLKEWQQRKTETTRALLRALDGKEDAGESPLLQMIKEFRG